MKPHSRHSLRGSALVAAIGSVAILTMLGGTVLLNAINRRATMGQSAVWEEALIVAEAGVHQGVAQLEQALAYGNAGSGNSDKLPTGTQSFTLNLPHVGIYSNSGSATYTLTRNNGGPKNAPYYGIVSTGTVFVPGRRILSGDSRDIILRKLDFRNSQQKAVRKISAWVRPIFNTSGPLKTNGAIAMNTHNIFVDSFDSSDPVRSMSGKPGTMGQFNVAPYNIMAANVMTNSSTLDTGHAYIYGDALTNGGVVGSADHVYGEVRDDYYEPISPVSAPSWVSSVTPGVQVPKGNGNATQTVTKLNTSATIRGGTITNPARYVLDSIALAGSGDVVTFDYGINGLNGSVDTTQTYIEIYVSGNISTKGGGGSGDGAFTIVNGVNVKMYTGGDFYLGGNGFVNSSERASTLQIYGVNPTAPATQTITLGGSSKFYGTVDAPGAKVVLNGGGNQSTYVGSIIADTVDLKGDVEVRYDEALSNQGLIQRFMVVSWFEDTTFGGAFSGTVN